MKLFFLFFVILTGIFFRALCPAPLTHAAEGGFQRIDIPSSLQPAGSGARALGMGGAFISVADDATAASWNPAGLLQLERPEISAVAQGLWRTESLSFSDAAGNFNENTDRLRLNYLSAALPFRLGGRNYAVSLNYQHLYDFDRDWSFSLNQSGRGGLTVDQTIQNQQAGQMGAWGLAFAADITHTLSLGITVNRWGDGLQECGWKETSIQTGAGISQGDAFTFSRRLIERYDAEGWNANLGLLWRITPFVTAGFVYKSPWDAKLSRTAGSYESIHYPDHADAGYERMLTESSRDRLRLPPGYGAGISWRISDHILAAVDLYRTEWDKAEYRTEDGRTTSPITGDPDAGSVDATHQIRLGMEYLIRGNQRLFPLRAGFFYDPVPSRGAPDDVFGLSLGCGVAVERFTWDLAWQYRFGNGVGEDPLAAWGFGRDLGEHMVVSSLVVYF